MTLQPAVAYHEDLAANWHARYGSRSFARRAGALLGLIGQECQQDRLWLDVGCGAGSLAFMLAGRGCRVIGLDPSPRMIKSAQRLRDSGTGPSGPLPEFRLVGGIEHLDYPDVSVDGILCSSVLEYVSNPVACLNEFNRVLRPQGVLVVSVPNRSSVVRGLQRIGFGVTKMVLSKPRPRYLQYSRFAFTLAEFTRLLSASGFGLESARYFGAVCPETLGKTTLGGSLILASARKRG